MTVLVSKLSTFLFQMTVLFLTRSLQCWKMGFMSAEINCGEVFYLVLCNHTIDTAPNQASCNLLLHVGQQLILSCLERIRVSYFLIHGNFPLIYPSSWIWKTSKFSRGLKSFQTDKGECNSRSILRWGEWARKGRGYTFCEVCMNTLVVCPQ